jgi:hypothetical protein
MNRSKRGDNIHSTMNNTLVRYPRDIPTPSAWSMDPAHCAWSVELLTYWRGDTCHAQFTSTNLYDVVHSICTYNPWTYPYLCLECDTTRNYLHTKEKTHDIHTQRCTLWKTRIIRVLLSYDTYIHTYMHAYMNKRLLSSFCSTYIRNSWRMSSYFSQ